MATASEMVPKFVKILHRVQDSPDVFTITLDTQDFEFEPGQFNMLYAFGAGEAAISISGSQDGHVVHTIRQVGSVTGRLSSFSVGDEVGIRGPFGRPWPLQEASDVVIVAGGIGLAPLRPVIEYVHQNRQKYRHVHVIYGARNPRDLLYTPALRTWAQNMNVQVTVDSAGEDWVGHVGVVIPLIENLSLDVSNTFALACGPELMMRFAAAELQGKGLTGDRIYVSMERNMKCAVAHCGHCQVGPHFVCKDGPVFTLNEMKPFWAVREM